MHLNKISCLLTINDYAKIRDLYKHFNIIKTKVGYFVSRECKGRKKYRELIIMNY